MVEEKYSDEVGKNEDEELIADEDPPEEDGPEDGEDGDEPTGPWVTAMMFFDPMQSQLARVKLESEGIDCYLDNEFIVATDWLLTSATGGIKLKVLESEVARAREILNAKSEGTDEAEEDDGERAKVCCPGCGSRDIYRANSSKLLAFLSILLLRFPIPLPVRVWRCAACGHEWRKNTGMTKGE